MSSLTQVVSPEQEELQEKRQLLAELRQTLADEELVLSTLKGELSLFERRYHHVVGVKYTELDEVKARILELAAQFYPRSDDFRASARAARERARQSSQETADFQPEEEDKEDFKPSEDLKKLFREAAKKIHPDLAADPEEQARRHELMARLNQAYDRQDEEMIRTVLLDWEAERPAQKQETLGLQLVRTLRQIQQVRTRLDRIQRELEAMRDSSLYHLMQKIRSAADPERDLLEEMADGIEEKIITLKSRVRDIADTLEE